MENKSKWASIQSLIITLIVVLILSYIGIDAFKTKPQIKQEVEIVKVQYMELFKYLDKKIPEIDSTLKEQGGKIIQQTTDIEEIKTSIKKIVK
jgi:hypothetical protein